MKTPSGRLGCRRAETLQPCPVSAVPPLRTTCASVSSVPPPSGASDAAILEQGLLPVLHLGVGVEEHAGCSCSSVAVCPGCLSQSAHPPFSVLSSWGAASGEVSSKSKQGPRHPGHLTSDGHTWLPPPLEPSLSTAPTALFLPVLLCSLLVYGAGSLISTPQGSGR